MGYLTEGADPAVAEALKQQAASLPVAAAADGGQLVAVLAVGASHAGQQAAVDTETAPSPAPAPAASGLPAAASPVAAVSVPRVTFLYKLTPGAADQSFGLNVARMAHIPADVVARAAVKAAGMRAAVERRAAGGSGGASGTGAAAAAAAAAGCPSGGSGVQAQAAAAFKALREACESVGAEGNGAARSEAALKRLLAAQRAPTLA